jgi:hypothetical protein
MQPDARVCPHCQRTQSRFDTRDPRMMLVSLVVVFLVLVAGQPYFARTFDPFGSASAVIAKGLVVIVEPSFSVLPAGTGSCETGKVVVVGKIRNNSTQGIRDLQIVANFYSGDHRLIDVVTEWIWRITIPAGGELGFRATATPKAAPSEYSTFDVKVVGGRALD